MTYDNIAFESWCDSVMIACEGKMVQAKDAKTVSDESSLMTAINNKTPLIKLSGKTKDKALEFFNKKKDARKTGTAWIWAGLLVFMPFIIPGIMQRMDDKDYENIKYYKVTKNSSGSDVYIIRKGYDLV